MATGDTSDFVSRLKAQLPTGWFPDQAPTLTAILTGFADCMAWLYSLISYANLQTRISTATDVFLDIIGLDYLGTTVTRKQGESDTSWRRRLQQEILAPKVTRQAMIDRLTTLTGRTPDIFEPGMPRDPGGLNVGSLALGAAGGLGNTGLPGQSLITVYRPNSGGIASYAGLGYMGFGYSGLADDSMLQGQITDADIYAAVASCAAEGTIPWTRITN